MISLDHLLFVAMTASVFAAPIILADFASAVWRAFRHRRVGYGPSAIVPPGAGNLREGRDANQPSRISTRAYA